jgi:hypothetical protein
VVKSENLYRCTDELRNSLTLSLPENIVEELIENDGAGRYRISTHPDFITYDADALIGFEHKNKALEDLTHALGQLAKPKLKRAKKQKRSKDN